MTDNINPFHPPSSPPTAPPAETYAETPSQYGLEAEAVALVLCGSSPLLAPEVEPALLLTSSAMRSAFEEAVMGGFTEVHQVLVSLRDQGKDSGSTLRSALWEIRMAQDAVRQLPDVKARGVLVLETLEHERKLRHAREVIGGAQGALDRGEVPALDALSLEPTGARIESASGAAASWLAGMKRRWSGEDAALHIPLHPAFAEISEAMGGGWRRGAVSVVAARPSSGKSSLCEMEALHHADNGLQVLFLPLEMGQEAHVGRMVQRAAYDVLGPAGQLGVMRGAAGRVSETASRAIVEACAAISSPHLRWAEPALNVDAVISTCIAAHRAKPVDIIIIDYFQLLSDPGMRTSMRNYELASVAKKLLALCKQLRCALILVAQFNRGLERREGDNIPKLSDLADCGELDNFTHTALFLMKAAEDTEHIDIKLALGKARSGRQFATSMVSFHGPALTFSAERKIESMSFL